MSREFEAFIPYMAAVHAIRRPWELVRAAHAPGPDFTAPKSYAGSVAGSSDAVLWSFDVEKPSRLTEDEDLSIDVLFEDFVCVLQRTPPRRRLSCMGGGVVVRACPRLLKLKYRVSSVAVLDVVEGASAMEALPHMLNLLNARFDGFDSPEAAIEWQWVARPSFLPRGTHDILGPLKAKTIHIATSAPLRPRPVCRRTSSDVAVVDGAVRSALPRTLLVFSALSLALAHRPLRRFLAACTARLLLLAGMDRLDRPLMIAQMQGSSTWRSSAAWGICCMMSQVGPIFVYILHFPHFLGHHRYFASFSPSREATRLCLLLPPTSPPALLPSTHPHRRPRFFFYTDPIPLIFFYRMTLPAPQAPAPVLAAQGATNGCYSSFRSTMEDKWKGVGGGLGDLLTTGVLLLLVLRPLAFASFRFDLVTGECGFYGCAVVASSPPQIPSFLRLPIPRLFLPSSTLPPVPNLPRGFPSI
ncbi:hypothetical protein C8J57DRAFT_1510779 [Mycena rebaudengoi]|nr:hypothetical protein C8J57DRAFT_1510779 [Mycena rebaudengoi]